MTHTTYSPIRSSAASPGASSWALLGAGLVSAGAAALGLTGWRDPGSSPLTQADGPLLGSLLPGTTVAGLVTVTGAAGLAGVLTGLRRGHPSSPGGRPGLAALFALEVVVLGFGLGSYTSIALAGYLVALALPVLLGVVVVQAVRRYRRVRWVVLGLVVAFGVWGATTGTLGLDSLTRLGEGLATGFATAAPRLVVGILSTVATAAFAVLCLAEIRGSDPWTRAGAYVTRHRSVWTIVAACCALPYGLVRMTWLTPWPVLGQAEQLTSEIRLWGLLLGGGALLGFVLTLGLVRPWGERFPRWVPRLAGRSVPVAAAAVPGGVVAAVVSTSALPMLYGLTITGAGGGLGIDTLAERVAMALVFPFWLWGPTLALAVWGYVVHRSSAAAEPRTGRVLPG